LHLASYFPKIYWQNWCSPEDNVREESAATVMKADNGWSLGGAAEQEIQRDIYC